MDMVPVLNMSVDRRVKQRQHTDQAVQMCVQKRKAFYSLFAGIFMCMAVCMRKGKK